MLIPEFLSSFCSCDERSREIYETRHGSAIPNCITKIDTSRTSRVSPIGGSAFLPRGIRREEGTRSNTRSRRAEWIVQPGRSYATSLRRIRERSDAYSMPNDARSRIVPQPVQSRESSENVRARPKARAEARLHPRGFILAASPRRASVPREFTARLFLSH